MRPTLRGVLVVFGAFPVALACALISARLWTLWAAYVAGTLVLLGLDAILGVPKRRLKLVAEVPPTLYMGDDAHDPLAVKLSAPGHRIGAQVELSAELADDLVAQPVQSVLVRPRTEAQAQVALVPRRRGEHAVHAIHARWGGPLGLMRRQARIKVDGKVDVVPNVRAVRAAALRFFSSKDFLSGLKIEHYVGDGSEFDALREYVPGLDHRAIDWKSSARHRKLLVQEFRAERNHQVVVAVDQGHLMSEPVDGVPKLDHAINAGLLLGYFGLRTGDRVGLYGFDARMRTWSEPQGGMGSFGRLQVASAELAYSTAETNFTLGLAELSQRLKRRSLVILLTDFVDVVTAQLMVENLDRLARRHLVVFVTLRDPGLARIAEGAPRTSLDLYRSVVAGDLMREREVVLKRLRRMGLFTIDADPAQVSVQLLNRYLDIKRREMI